MFGCAQRQAARANNSSYNNNAPSRSRARLGLLRPSYCLDTCLELGSQQGHRVPAACRHFPSLPLPSLEKEERKAAKRGEGAARRQAARDCGRRVRCSTRSRAASRRRREDCHRGRGGRDSKPGKSSCTLRRAHLRAAVGGAAEGLRPPRCLLWFRPPLPSGVCCGAAAYPGDARG